jgi:hydroxysqualene dehydroxylase
MSKSVSVIGGGLSGISAAVYLHNKGFDVTLFEATAKLGGRTFSFEDRETGETLDNGQHIFAGWYKNTFEMLGIMGKKPNLHFHDALEVYFKDTDGKEIHFKASGDNPLIAAAKGFVNYSPLSFRDKLKLLGLRELIEIDIRERLLKGKKLDWLLMYLKQNKNLMKYFWEPFVFAVFNTSPQYVDAEIFYNVLDKAFTDVTTFSLIIPGEPLEEIFVKPFLEYAIDRIHIRTQCKISKLELGNNRIKSAFTEQGEEIKSDFYISAVPSYNHKTLFSEEDYAKYFGLKQLQPVSIISLYLFPEKDISYMKDRYYYGMIGLIDKCAHWVFFKEKYLCVVVSAPEYTIKGFDKYSVDEFIDLLTGEVRSSFPELKNTEFMKVKYFREKRATFLPEFNTRDFRPDCETKIENYFIAGDWTNTGLPSVIEGAVSSGKKCSEVIEKGYL